MLAHRAHQGARKIADRHYNRQKVGAPQFVPPGRCVVLYAEQAFWVTSWPFPEYVKHDWPGAWVCSAFRREGGPQASQMILEAVAATLYIWPDGPQEGIITFVNPDKVRHKRDPGRCFVRAGFEQVGQTKGGLLAFHLSPDKFPFAQAPIGAQDSLFAPDIDTTKFRKHLP